MVLWPNSLFGKLDICDRHQQYTSTYLGKGLEGFRQWQFGTNGFGELCAKV